MEKLSPLFIPSEDVQQKRSLGWTKLPLSFPKPRPVPSGLPSVPPRISDIKLQHRARRQHRGRANREADQRRLQQFRRVGGRDEPLQPARPAVVASSILAMEDSPSRPSARLQIEVSEVIPQVYRRYFGMQAPVAPLPDHLLESKYQRIKANQPSGVSDRRISRPTP